jgi:Domain of unknown function (DUF4389)
VCRRRLERACCTDPGGLRTKLVTSLGALTSIVAWFAILFTGRYPAGLYEFAVGVLCWDLRVEAHILLMRDEYPPFTLAP